MPFLPTILICKIIFSTNMTLNILKMSNKYKKSDIKVPDELTVEATLCQELERQDWKQMEDVFTETLFTRPSWFLDWVKSFPRATHSFPF